MRTIEEMRKRGPILGTDKVAESSILSQRIAIAIEDVPPHQRDDLINAVNETIIKFYDDHNNCI